MTADTIIGIINIIISIIIMITLEAYLNLMGL